MPRRWTPCLVLCLALGTGITASAAEPTAADPTPLEPVASTASGTRTEMPGSGFAMTFPDDWTVQPNEPDIDVFAAMPGTAWEALTATAPDGHMACSVVVGVATVPFYDPPQRAGSGLGQDGVEDPFWDPDAPHVLWVPEPRVPDAGSSMQITWDRLQDQAAGLAGDAAYSLLCITSDPDDAEPGGIFDSLMASFEFLPAEAAVAES